MGKEVRESVRIMSEAIKKNMRRKGLKNKWKNSVGIEVAQKSKE